MKKIIFFDLDGTVYLNNSLLPYAKELFNYLNEHKITYVFLTNNSSISKINYLNKLTNLTIKTNLNNIYSSTDHLLSYLKEINVKNIYLLGTKDLEEELLKENYNIIKEYKKGSIDRVVIGFDKTLTYQKLKETSLYIQDDVKVISTHIDKRCPYDNGYYIPDAGSIVDLLNSTSPIKDLVVLGKPHPEMILNVLKEKGFKKKEALIVGDRFYTDVLCGVNAGVDSGLILTGESRLEDLKGLDYKPTYIFKDLKEVLNLLKK